MKHHEMDNTNESYWIQSYNSVIFQYKGSCAATACKAYM